MSGISSVDLRRDPGRWGCHFPHCGNTVTELLNILPPATPSEGWRQGLNSGRKAQLYALYTEDFC